MNKIKNYRLEGLTRRSEEVIQDLKEHGLLPADIEVIGALLFTKHQGADARLEELFSNSRKLREEAEALLERLKNKIDEQQ
jgi:hypothetical protein